MKKKMIRFGCMILAVIIMLCPLSACFATGEVADVLIEDIIIDLIWESLRAWGIKIYENGVDEINENIRQILSGDLYEYLSDELSEGFDQWITGIQWVHDNFGRRMVNALGLDKIYLFAVWLKTKYGLTDDSVEYIESNGYEVGGITIYQLPIYGIMRTSGGDDHYVLLRFQSTSSTQPYFVLRDDGQSLAYPISTTYNDSYSAMVDDLTQGNHPMSAAGSIVASRIGGYSTSPWYIGDGLKCVNDRPASHWIGDHYTAQEISSALSGDSTVDQIGVYIDTDTITFPVDDPMYEQGMSIIYYPDGTVGYVAINWPDSVSVDNLPAIVSTGSIPNPGFADVFLPLRAFVNTFTDGMAVIKDVVFHLPTEALAIFYAIMSITVIFGALHMFKEH